MADYTVTPADVQHGAEAKTTTGIAGAAIIAGQAVYRDPADGLYKLSDCDSATTAAARTVDGIALNSAPGAGQPITVCTYDADFTPGFAIAAGVIVVLSGTAGGLAPAADLTTGDYPIILGVGIGSNKIVLNCGRQALKGTTVMG